MAMDSNSVSSKLHFIIFPLLAQGHMIPLIDIAKLLARRNGVTVTVITTPVNAARYKLVFARAKESGLDLNLHLLQFPWKEAGLAEGCENMDMLPSPELNKSFFLALDLLQPQLEHFLESVQPRPSCIIHDMLLFSPFQVAPKFGIPRIVFLSSGCFPQSCAVAIIMSELFLNVTSDTDPLLVPGLPHRVKFTKAQVGRSVNLDSTLGQGFLQKIEEVCTKAYGVVINSFEGLEPEYVKLCTQNSKNKVYVIGPVSLCNDLLSDKAQRGNNSSMDENECMKWLDSRHSSSVVYACLGSLNNLKGSQMMELGLGLESSNHPFIWVIGGNNSDEFEKLILQNGFEERVKGRGLLIRGWAPQVLILSHPSIGAFLTHCGWNSTLEGVSAGVPLITWPLFADQFYNEGLVVQLLDIGVGVGAKASTLSEKGQEGWMFVPKEDVEKAVSTVMDKGKEGDRRRIKARQLGEMAKKAMEEGGSSHIDITRLIEDIRQQICIE